MNKRSLSSEPGEHVSFVTVFTTYGSDPAGAGKRSSDVGTVGKYSYSKEEKSMAILNTFVSFIQVDLPFPLVFRTEGVTMKIIKFLIMLGMIHNHRQLREY